MFGAGLGGGVLETVTTAVELAGVGEYVGGLNRMGRAWGDVEGAQTRAGRVGAGMEKLGAGLTIGVTGSEIALVSKAIKVGMDAIESDSLVATTFGQNTDKIIAWSKQRAAALGVNSFDQRRQAASFQNQFTAGGIDENKALALSQAFTAMKDDYVSFKNIADPEVFAALQSGINGEAEPLRRLSIFMSDAAVKAYALKKGIGDANGELTEQQKVAARAGFILDEFNKSKASGDLERTKDSPTNRLRAQKNQLAEEMTNLGIAAMPLLTDALDIGNKILPHIKQAVEWFSKLDDTTRKWILGIVGAVGPLTLISGKIISAVAAIKALRGGGGEGGDDSILGKVQGKVAEKIEGKIDSLFDKGESGATRVARMTVHANVVSVRGQNVRGGSGAAGVGGAGSAAAGGVAAEATRSALSRFLFPAGVVRNMGPHVPGMAGWWASQAPSGAGLGAAAKAPGTILAGIGLGVAGYEGLRHLSPKFAENHGNTFEAGRNVWGRLTHRWDSARGQSKYDSQMQMQDASRKYQSDVGQVKKAASDWATKNGKSPAQQQVEYFRRLSELEKDWSRQYASNLSIGGFNTHETKRRAALGEMQKAQDKVFQDWLHATYPADAFKPAQISNSQNQRGFIQKWLRDKVKDGTFTTGSAKAYLANYDKDQATARGEKPKMRQTAWTDETRALAANFGLSSGAPSSEMGGEAFDGSNTLTIKIPPRRADADHRATRTGNNTPRPPIL